MLCIASVAYAHITSLDISGSADASGKLALDATASFYDSQGKEACLLFSAPVSEVLVRDRSGLAIEHRIVSDGEGAAICASVPHDHLRFTVRSDSFTIKSGPLWGLGIGIGASESVDSASARLSLPAGAVITSTNGAVEADSGTLSLHWNAGGLEPMEMLRMEASYEVRQAKHPDYMVLAAAGIVALASIAAATRFMQGWRARKSPGQKPAEKAHGKELESGAAFKMLDETDKEIVREIHRQDGKTTQARLYLNTHVPKATLSRRLSSLERKGIISRSKKGNRKLVSLADQPS